MVAITRFSREDIFDAVKLMYTNVANEPHKTFHFPTGRPACECVGYPREQLDRIIPTALESFAGVGYPFAANVISEGDSVLDIGAGAGTDVFLSALLTGPKGTVYGLDMTRAMQEKLERNCAAMGMSHVIPLSGNAEKIPLEDGAVDVVTSNGVLNLVPDKQRAFAEIHRVLKPGGHIQIADIIINQNQAALEQSRSNPRLWAECIVGAMEESAYLAGFEAAGFEGIRRIAALDYFAYSASESTRKVAASFGATSITLVGRKPT